MSDKKKVGRPRGRKDSYSSDYDDSSIYTRIAIKKQTAIKLKELMRKRKKRSYQAIIDDICGFLLDK